MHPEHPIQFPLDTSETEHFRRALSESDRLALDEILSVASQNQSALAHANHP